jgi:hypothetical protein
MIVVGEAEIGTAQGLRGEGNASEAKVLRASADQMARYADVMAFMNRAAPANAGCFTRRGWRSSSDKADQSFCETIVFF